MGGLVMEWLWPYNGQPTRFFKTPKGLVSDTRPWPYNRGNTVYSRRWSTVLKAEVWLRRGTFEQRLNGEK